MKRRHLLDLPVLLFFFGLVACGGRETADAPASEEPSTPTAEAPEPDVPLGTVRILEPADGVTVDGPDLRVVLAIGGMEIRPAGDMTPNSGHHHLYLDHDLTDPTEPIPAIPGQVIHMGDGSSEYVFEGVEAGEHRIIAVVGNHVHVPLQPWVVDTVYVTVR
jgi:hypothetical protein